MGALQVADWIEQSRAAEFGLCLTAVSGTSAESVHRGFGVLPDGGLGDLDLDAAFDRLAKPHVTLAQIFGIGDDAWLCVELAGYHGVTPGVCWRVGSSRYTSLSWNVEGASRFVHALQGDIVVYADLERPVEARRPDDPRWDAGVVSGLDFDEDFFVSSLTLFERVHRIDLDVEWFAGARPAFELPDVSDFLSREEIPL